MDLWFLKWALKNCITKTISQLGKGDDHTWLMLLTELAIGIIDESAGV